MAHKYNLYFAMIFEKEEFDHKGGQVVLYLQFCTDNITASTILYLFKIQNSMYNFVLEVPLIALVIAKDALYWTDSIFLSKEDRFGWS